jgi:bifunctional ADP-heptose synthase (sugar kinase/adenylyltransferase)
MSSTYFLDIHNESQGRTTAFAYGKLAEISLIGKNRVAEMKDSTDRFVVAFVEITQDGVAILDDNNDPHVNAVKREVTMYTGDGATAALVLKAKLAAERKQQQDAQLAETPEDSAEIVDSNLQNAGRAGLEQDVPAGVPAA